MSRFSNCIDSTNCIDSKKLAATSLFYTTTTHYEHTHTQLSHGNHLWIIVERGKVREIAVCVRPFVTHTQGSVVRREEKEVLEKKNEEVCVKS